MNEILKDKSPAKKFNKADFFKSLMVLVVLALGAIVPQLAEWAEQMIGGSDAANTLYGYIILWGIEMFRRYRRDNTKE